MIGAISERSKSEGDSSGKQYQKQWWPASASKNGGFFVKTLPPSNRQSGAPFGRSARASSTKDGRNWSPGWAGLRSRSAPEVFLLLVLSAPSTVMRIAR